MKKLYVTFFYLLMISVLMSACTSTKLAISDPHFYQNSYSEAMNAVYQSLELAHMRIVEKKTISSDEYFIRYRLADGAVNILSSRESVTDQTGDFGLHGYINIQKIGDNKTRIHIQEDDQPGKIPSSFRQHLAKDVYRQLNQKLTLLETEN